MASVGFDLGGWKAPPAPPGDLALAGRYVQIVRAEAARHGASLHAAFGDTPGLWTYMPYGPFESAGAYTDWLAAREGGQDPLFLALQDRASGRWGGIASFLRIDPSHGVIEAGHIVFAPAFSQSRAATEAIFLLMAWAFAAGYRRFEWKCDALNAKSRRAARRLGFTYEGTFRQAVVVKGRNRDTAWFAVIDRDWPRLRAAFERWLDPGNFDAEGRQRLALSALTAPLLPPDPGA